MEKSKSTSEPEVSGLIKEIQDLKGHNPKFLGYDYYHVIYATAIALILAMLWVYVSVTDP